MEEPVTISSVKSSNPSENYDLLRVEGIQHIQSLSSKIWTDYNTHDPGITILEQLSYAITELGYRSNLDIKDIVATRLPGARPLESDYFTAARILTCRPVTVLDYRKIAVDTEGVKNAFFEISNRSEQTIFVNEGENHLDYNNTDKDGLTNEQVVLNGLYRVVVELDESDEFGDLNSNKIKSTLVNSAEKFVVEIVFPNWLVSPEILQSDFTISSITANVSFVRTGLFKADLTINGTGDPVLLTLNINLLTPLFRKITTETDIQNLLKDLLEDDSDKGVIKFFNKKLVKIWDIFTVFKNRLYNNRNLCEDFFEFKSLEVEEIAICSKIEVAPGVNVSEILARILFEVENYLSPRANFYSISDLLDRGKRIEEIFEGPVLGHGFIDNEEFERLRERETVHVSDLVHIIMSIPGVLGIKDIELSSYIDNVLAVSKAMECIKQTFPLSHRLRLSVDRSSVIFFRDEDPSDPNVNYLLPNMIEVQDIFSDLKIDASKKHNASGLRDLPIPEGELRDLDDYYSIQNDFPMLYGIGEGGTRPVSGSDPASIAANNLRIAQARQLKAYLIFSEQLLANFFSQLSHVRDLLSFDDTVDRTYYTQFLSTIPDIEAIIPTPDQSSYMSAMGGYAESESLFIERRNRFLDHLVARFADDFSAYSLKMFDLFGEEGSAIAIQDKIEFLRDMPVITAERFKAFNYKLTQEGSPSGVPDVWDTDNVSGYEKRVARKLGIRNYKRRSLFFTFDERIEDIEHYFDLTEIGGSYFFELKPDFLSFSVTGFAGGYASEEDRNNALSDLILYGINFCNYCRDNAGAPPYTFIIRKANNDLERSNICGSSPSVDEVSMDFPTFATEQERDTAAEQLSSFLFRSFWGSYEGMHVVEHLLLRPKTNKLAYIQVTPFNEAEPGSLSYKKTKPVYSFELNAKKIIIQGNITAELSVGTKVEVIDECYGGNTYTIAAIALNIQGNTVVTMRESLDPDLEPEIFSYPRTYALASVTNLPGSPLEIKAVIASLNLTAELLDANIFNILNSDDNNGTYLIDSVSYNAPDTEIYFTKTEKLVQDKLLPINVEQEDEECFCPMLKDAYTFRVSIVLPTWPVRFNDPVFRKFIERTLRMEAPAHILVKIIWVSMEQMKDFEPTYKAWLEENAKAKPDEIVLSQNLNTFTDELFALKNQYVAAVLQDISNRDSSVEILTLGSTLLS